MPAVVDAFKSLIRHGRHHHHVHKDEPPAPNTAPREAAELVVQHEKEDIKRPSMPSYKGLEDYILADKMGDGAFSNVYKATENATGKRVAIKVVRKYELNASQSLIVWTRVDTQAGERHLNPHFKKKPRVTERSNILKEVQIMRGISHPSIVKLFSFSESPEHYFLVLELMEGGELFHQIVKLTYFSENLSRHVILQVARGIRYLHEERGVVHRDIKPENLLFERIDIIPSKNPIRRPYDEDKVDEGEFIPGVGGGGIGRVKIADFGLSKVVWDQQTMTPCGTVGYTAPEIVKDERYSKSVDMWALGCVLYTLLCGFPPFYDESINVLTEKVAKGVFTFLSPWWDDISLSSKDLISHLLCVDPAERYTIDQFLNHPWCTAEPAPPPPPTPYANGPVKHPLDSPLLSAARGRPVNEGPSPGIASLKEAFDITYAVHRMEEEGARRRAYKGRTGGGFLAGLNEEGEEDYDDEPEQDHEATKQPYHPQPHQYQPHQHKDQHPPRGRADAPLANQPQSSITDGRAGVRDQGKGRIITAAGASGMPPPSSTPAGSKARRGNHHRAFELDLENATLLERRQRHKRLANNSPHANGATSPLAGKPLTPEDAMDRLRVTDPTQDSPAPPPTGNRV